MDLKNNRRGRISEYASHFDGVTFTASAPEPTPNGLWGINVDVALPCATQNELNGPEAQMLVDNNVMAVAEGANMPTISPEVLREVHGAVSMPTAASNADVASAASLIDVSPSGLVGSCG